MKKGSVLWLIWNIIVAAAFVTLGIVSMANSGNVDFRKVVILIVGIVLVVFASLQLLFTVIGVVRVGNKVVVRTDFGAAVASASELSLGIVLIMVHGEQENMRILFQYLSNFLGILLIVMGAIVVFYGILYLVRKLNGKLQNILFIICGLILITLGVLAIVFLNRDDNFLVFFFIIFGLFLLATGLAYLYVSILLFAAARKLAKAEAKPEEKKEGAIEVEEVKPEEKKEEPVEETKPEEPKPEDPTEGDK